jgi:hypothetical protein
LRGSVGCQTYRTKFDMEAVTALSLEAEVEPAVQVRDGSVFVNDLRIDDATLAELIERRRELDIAPDETVRQAAEIGARVLDRESTRADVDMVKREFERVSAEVERSFIERASQIGELLEEQFERFLGEGDGTMAKALDAHAGELDELIAEHFGGDRSTAVQHQLRELVARLLTESRQDLVKQFSAEDGHNPLSDFKAAVVREMKRSGEVNERLIEKLAQLEGEVKRLRDADEARDELEAERERGTSKGRAFEQRAFEVLEQIAAARGDVAHHVGDERSASGGKRGDIVIELDAGAGRARGRIAIDAKDEKLSKNRAWEVLNSALRERDAGFAMLVVASDEKIPSGREPLHEYEGNKMIVTLDKESFDQSALELAYRYARCRCLMTVERELQIDAPGVRDEAQEALSALKDAQRIRSSLTGASNSVTSARQALDAMVERVEVCLARVETLIGSP